MQLELQNIKKSYGEGGSRIEVLKDISLGIEQGEFVVLLGPSGSGKSTLLNIIGGIDNADSGKIVIRGKSMADMDEKALTTYRREHLGYIFQMYNLIPNLTVRENIEVGAYLSHNPLNIDEIIEILGLKEHQNKLPSQLSGGQQQRCAIGRAIVKNPDILLCDEPTGALDSKTGVEVLKLLREQADVDTTVIIVTHNALIADIADRVIKIKNGKVEENIINKHPKNIDEVKW